ncbi:hypothetical protein BVER_04462c [Candidatus Burkholderia verschuerenii]|uniref:HEPN domain-containing protein n=1 Tax=Candidatus Burkholderia verschuerenii TaxID=242163 RepID=A0A0L0MFN3_9BURK|nr:hypothetical protein [Candidatus Burkholderia verschuerenii]KND61512.1 hypothetical protein BVER_04462c [Candidatus Burkholderia verschuerenii]
MRGDTVAAAFINNASGFAEATTMRAPDAIEARLEAASIAIELSLKAVILHQGGTDKQNRAEIGHDLTKAWHLASAYGFEPNLALMPIVNRLSPYYSRHALAEIAGTMRAGELAEIVAAVRLHVEAVRRWMEMD